MQNSDSLDTTAHKSAPSKWLHTAMITILAGWLCFLNWHMFRHALAEAGVAFPEWIALIGLATLDGGAWIWKNTRAKYADSDEQETLALWMAWVDLILAVAAGVVHLAQILNMMALPAWTGYLVTSILGIATAVNVCAGFAFALLDPGFLDKQRLRRLARIYRDRRQANLEKLALSHADADAAESARQTFAQMRSGWLASQGPEVDADTRPSPSATNRLNATVADAKTPASFP